MRLPEKTVAIKGLSLFLSISITPGGRVSRFFSRNPVASYSTCESQVDTKSDTRTAFLTSLTQSKASSVFSSRNNCECVEICEVGEGRVTRHRWDKKTVRGNTSWRSQNWPKMVPVFLTLILSPSYKVVSDKHCLDTAFSPISNWQGGLTHNNTESVLTDHSSSLHANKTCSSEPRSKQFSLENQT